MHPTFPPRRLLCAAAIAVYAAGCASAPPSVDQIVVGPFHRVAGPRAAGAVLDTTQAGDWGSYVVGLPTVDFDGKLFRMWFAATPTIVQGQSPYLYRSSIGLATSADGLTWSLANDGQPVFTKGPAGSFDSLAVSHPVVVRVDGSYMMWYGGADGTAAPVTGVRIERLGLATSTDGIHWTRQNDGRPVLDVGPQNSLDSIQATGAAIIRTPTGFRMWYGAYNGTHTIVSATSRDGIRWNKETTPAAGLQQETGALGPSVYFDGRKYLMLYSIISDRQWVMVGATSADGATWTPIAGGARILPAPDPNAFDSAGPGRNHSVHPSELIVHAGRVLVWYTGEDAHAPNLMRIGLMERKLGQTP